MKTIRDLKGAWAGAEVAILGTGPSLTEVCSQRHRKFSHAMGCNLSFERVAGSHAMTVCDYPRLIQPAEKRERFMKAPREIPLCCPIEAVEQWPDHNPHGFVRWVPMDIYQRSVEVIRLDKETEGTRIPIMPYYGGVALTAAAIALYMGAKKVVLAGVDFDGTTHDRNIVAISKVWVKLRECAESMGSDLEQGNTRSRLQFSGAPRMQIAPKRRRARPDADTAAPADAATLPFPPA